MPTLRCKKCGGDLNIIDTESSLCECEYCGSKETLPTMDNEKLMKLYDRANRLRMSNEFDKAASVYESIVEESDIEAEAYWGLVLCKYGIEYVDDPVSGDKIPTCHRLSFDSVLEDPDFELVMENADMVSRNVYRDNAKQIEDIRRGIIEVSDKEEPYDIFICYKETDENGDRTIDSVMAQNVYDALTTKGYRVFFSRITLEDKLGQEYEPYIFAALNSSKVMLAFGTNYDYYNAVWVKNEWSRYLKLMATDKSKKLIPCYKDIDAYDIPKEFKHLQAQDFGKVGAEQDLIRGVDKILHSGDGSNATSENPLSGANVQDIQVAVASAVAANTGANVDTLLERGFMTLEDGDFDKSDELFENVLNHNPKCAEAYMGKLMTYHKVKNLTCFVELIYEKVISKYLEEEINLEFDVKDVIQTNYIMGNQLSDGRIEQIKNVFNTTYKTNIASLQKYDATKDYVEIFNGLDNDSHDNSSQLDDRYYARYKQYATEEIRSRFNISVLLSDFVSKKMQEENNRINAIKREHSKEGMEELLEQANARVKSIVGDKLDQVEAKFQAEIKAWKVAENAKQDAYKKECQVIKENWPAKRIEIQNTWKAECDRLTTEYKKKKAEYDSKKAYVEANNERVRSSYNQAKEEYEKETNYLHSQINNMKKELAGLGLFKGKQKEALKQKINMLEAKKNALTVPVQKAYGSILLMPKPLEALQLPVQPVEPIYPKKPIPAEKPVREEISTEVDGVDELCKTLEDKGYETITIRRYKDIITMGTGPDGIPLEWLVLTREKNKVLLITKNIIDFIPYNEERVNITWETCTLRAYLNHDFFINTFSREEQEKIQQIKLSNSGTLGGNDTVDKVFCLSVDEVEKYFKEYKERAAVATEYANIKGKELGRRYYGWDGNHNRYRLRSPGDESDTTFGVDFRGKFYGGYGVHNEQIGIRPAVWVNLDT